MCFEVNNTVKNEKSNVNANLETASTQHSRARLVWYFIVTIYVSIFKKHVYICLDQVLKRNSNLELGVFKIVGIIGKPHAIRLFPKESGSIQTTYL